MTVYISRKAKIKFNLRVYYGKARNFLLLLIGVLSVLAVGLFIACMVLNARISRVNIEAGERIYAEELFGEGAYFGADYNKEFINHAGVYYFTAVTSKGERQVRLAVRDTKAPRVVTKDVYFAVGRDENGAIFLPEPLDFVESVYEPDGFKGEFIGGLPELKKPGEYTVRVQFSDASGNKTEVFTVKMTQISDNLPPTVDVSPLIVCPLGEAVEYKPYVAMTDNCIGALTFTVDESQLDINTVGEYAVYVTGRDRVGNESQRVRVTVKVVDSFDKSKLDGLLDTLVSKIAPEGKSREEICREIYKVTRSELVYTGGSQKGDVERAAYYALVGGGGDCYSYFALSKLLLERCGVENLDVRREEGFTPDTHFWSLVNISDEGGERWYHFDSTELRVDRYDHSGCLLTDRQIAAYSKARPDFYAYDKTLYPTVADDIITPTPRLEEFY